MTTGPRQCSCTRRLERIWIYYQPFACVVPHVSLPTSRATGIIRRCNRLAFGILTLPAYLRVDKTLTFLSCNRIRVIQYDDL